MVCGPDGLVLFVVEKTALEPAGDGQARTSLWRESKVRLTLMVCSPLHVGNCAAPFRLFARRNVAPHQRERWDKHVFDRLRPIGEIQNDTVRRIAAEVAELVASS